ncbi:hypothetical protein LC048_17790 [Mesobacillus subterraneus]|uniref:hypothetical protein n=1 Tax=Mesobacillus subterraneus TaxID=285983 RepID=UPI001CFC7BA6|nr:hypothetical protein [Mesobacillus subterraneus]WLR54280.1 hypothetical protein LC048_17790 [Mesobacillus subterraneus]
MTYEVKDSQVVTVHNSAGEETSLLVLNVEYKEGEYKHVKVFELNPTLTDEEITQVIVDAGTVLKQETKRDLNFSGVI